MDVMLKTHRERAHIQYEICTTREQTLERCPNLALASAFFAAGTKGPCPTVVRVAGIFSPGWYYQPGPG